MRHSVSSSLAVSVLVGTGVELGEFPALIVFHPELRPFICLEWSMVAVIGPLGSLNYASSYPVLFI